MQSFFNSDVRCLPLKARAGQGLAVQSCEAALKQCMMAGKVFPWMEIFRRSVCHISCDPQAAASGRQSFLLPLKKNLI